MDSSSSQSIGATASTNNYRTDRNADNEGNNNNNSSNNTAGSVRSPKSSRATNSPKNSAPTMPHDAEWPYADINTVTPAVLTHMIQLHWPCIHVTHFNAQQIGKGVGFGGKVFKLSGIVASQQQLPNMDIDSADTEEELWSSFVLKMSRGVWNNKKTVAEPQFYQQLASLVRSIALPKCLFATVHAQTGLSTLLLEDLSHLQLFNVKKQPVPKQVAVTAMRAVAKLHAEWWKSPTLNEFDWLPALNDPATKEGLTAKYAANWKQISPHLHDQLSEKAFDTCATLALVFPSVLDALMTGPSTLCHGDYWLGNMLFSNDWQAVHVIDWQSVCRGKREI